MYPTDLYCVNVPTDLYCINVPTDLYCIVMFPFVIYYNPSTVCLMLITFDNDICSTQGMLRNRISCVRGIVMIKANIIITSPQSACHNFIVIHKVQHHRATKHE